MKMEGDGDLQLQNGGAQVVVLDVVGREWAGKVARGETLTGLWLLCFSRFTQTQWTSLFFLEQLLCGREAKK